MHKKVIICLLTLLLSLPMFGCNTTQPEPTDSTDPITTTEATEPETVPGVVSTPVNDGNLDDSTVPTDEITSTTEPSTSEPTEGTEPSDTTDPTEETSPNTEATTPTDESKPEESELTAYEVYQNMSGEEQKAFMESFESIEAFVAWYNAAKAEYEALHPDIDIGDGYIDGGDLSDGGK